MNMKNHYEILEIDPLADERTIHSAYRTLMFRQRCHPDLGGDQELAVLINVAYETLTDPVKKSRYDLTLPSSVFKSVGKGRDEKRRVPRVYININITYMRGGRSREEGRLADISSLGCRLQTSKKLDIGEKISVKIAGHTVSGTVKWNRMFHPSVLQRVHEQGIEFDNEFEEIEKIKPSDLSK